LWVLRRAERVSRPRINELPTWFNQPQAVLLDLTIVFNND